MSYYPRTREERFKLLNSNPALDSNAKEPPNIQVFFTDPAYAPYAVRDPIGDGSLLSKGWYWWYLVPCPLETTTYLANGPFQNQEEAIADARLDTGGELDLGKEKEKGEIK